MKEERKRQLQWARDLVAWRAGRWRIYSDVGAIVREGAEPGRHKGPGRKIARRAFADLKRVGISVVKAKAVTVNADFALRTWDRLLSAILDGLPGNVSAADRSRWLENRLHDLASAGLTVSIRGVTP